MGLFICQYCDKQMGDLPHICEYDDISKRIHELEQRARAAELHATHIGDEIKKLMTTLTTLDNPTVTVSSELIRQIFNVINRDKEYSFADSFIVRSMALHSILSRSFDLFRKIAHPSQLREKLIRLKECCESAKNILGFQDSHLPLTPEDVINEAKKQ